MKVWLLVREKEKVSDEVHLTDLLLGVDWSIKNNLLNIFHPFLNLELSNHFFEIPSKIIQLTRTRLNVTATVG